MMGHRGLPILLVWGCTIFIGAGLLFLVQPMIAKTLLPMLGGSPAVWNTCIVFFQATLLAGYLYAHLLTRLESQRLQLIIHAVLLAATMILLPIGLPVAWAPPGDRAPIGWLFLTLALSVGGPFFLLSSAGPLLQNWFARTSHRLAKDPYFLYVPSNVGSMLALLGYPVIVEPFMTLPGQRRLWSIGYVVFAGLAVACGLMAWRRRQSVTEGMAAETAAPPPLRWWTRAKWILLAFVPSSLMLGVTQHLSTDIAAVPLLWVLPLGLYLLTFIIVFSKWGRGPVRVATWLLPVVAVVLMMLLMMESPQPVVPQIFAHLLGMLVIGLFCHGRLAASRPAAGQLTTFYLLMSIGGVLGGAFNSLIAPLLFNSIAEYPIALVLACLLRWRPPGKQTLQKAASWRHWRSHVDELLLPLLLIAVYVASPKIIARLGVEGEFWGVSWGNWCRFGLPAGVCLLFAPRPLRFALGLLALVLAPRFGFFADQQWVHAERTFFGVHQVARVPDGRGNWHVLIHGSTQHGAQYDQEPLASLPTMYYTKSGPVGDVLRVQVADGRPRQMAFIGLGAGALAAYGRPAWQMTYYEIDPEVVRIAKDEQFFTYLSQSKSPIDIVLGDARLKIAAAPDGHYDLILVDAFSSDAIPVHLITRQAVELYLKKLAPDGILMFNISNYYLNLAPVLGGIAADLKLVAAMRHDKKLTKQEVRQGKLGSQWAVLARTQAALGSIAGHAQWIWLLETPGMPVWTDDYSNILRVFKTRGGK